MDQNQNLSEGGKEHRAVPSSESKATPELSADLRIQGPRIVKLVLTKMDDDGTLYTETLEGHAAATWQAYTQATGILAHVHNANPDWGSLPWKKQPVSTTLVSTNIIRFDREDVTLEPIPIEDCSECAKGLATHHLRINLRVLGLTVSVGEPGYCLECGLEALEDLRATMPERLNEDGVEP